MQNSGFVYVMDDGALRKIGWSSAPEFRRTQIKRAAPVALVYKVATDIPMDVERAAHRELAEFRVEGEWFNVTVERAIEAVNFAILNPVARTETYMRTVRFSDDELELLEELTEQHGTATAAIVAGLQALKSRREPTNAELVALMTKRLGKG